MRAIFSKLGYSFLVLFGVVTVVFFIFNASPGDPARLIAGQNDSEEVLQNIRRNLGLDLPLHKQYLLYLNDISPLAIMHETDAQSRVFLDTSQYSATPLFAVGGGKSLVLKKPYLRRSYKTKRSVSSIISEALPGTILLAVVAIVLALLLGLTVGILAAVKKDSFFDRAALVLSVLGMSGPSFFVAILVAWIGGWLWHKMATLPFWPLALFIGGLLFGIFKKSKNKNNSISKWSLYGLGIGFGLLLLGKISSALFDFSIIPFANLAVPFPGTGLSMTGSLYEVDVWAGKTLALQNLILPAITLGVRPLGVIVQLTRNAMLDELSKDYIRTARAKGLPQRAVVLKHAFKNALNPVITAVSGWFASMLAGAVFVEFVFGWKGLGLEIFTALENQDSPVVLGGVLVIAVIFVAVNFGVDLIYGWLDPRAKG